MAEEYMAKRVTNKVSGGENVTKPAFRINHIGQSNFSDVKVFSSGYERVSAKKEPRDMSDFGSYSMHFVLSGSGVVEMSGKTHEVKANQIFFIFPNVPVKYYPEKAHPWRYSWMDFYGSKVLEILKRLGVSPDRPVIDSPASVGKFFLTNVSECLEHPDCSDFISVSKFYGVIAELIKLLPENGVSHEADSRELINKSLRLIDENFADPSFGLDFLASSVGLNSAYLSRLIKKHTGMNFSALLTQKRLSKAVYLIDAGIVRVNQLSYDVGFSDAYYFSKVFKKAYGTSPSEYVREITEKKQKGE